MLKFITILLILLSFILFNSCEDKKSPTKTKRVALIIGNSNYNGERLKALKNPQNDAMEMKRVLKDRGFEIIYDING